MTTAPAGPLPGTEPRPGRIEFRRAHRDSHDLVLGGVASGLARHLAWPVLWVRVGFVISAALSGFGIALYAGLWMVLPSDNRFEQSAPGLEGGTRTGRRPGRARRLTDLGPVVVLGVLGLGVVFVVQAVIGTGAVFWPVVLAGVGVALLWRQADEAQRERWLDVGGRVDPVRAVFGSGGWAAYVRVAAGATLVLTALIVFSVTTGSLSSSGPVVLAGLVGIGGLALVAGPWFLRLASDLTAERAERVRTQERADLAAHLHDSVLQTLALIQRNAGDAALVHRLARAQERDLRTWLYDAAPTTVTTLAGSLKAVAAAVEDDHGVVVDVVTVGDVGVDTHVRPLVEATREAVTNAAKHAGTGQVDVYGEVTPDQAEIFVRDRGRGFDVESVAADRMGVRGSILDRMTRHGGSAEVRSAPGEGTEVRLRMPLDPVGSTEERES